MAGHHGRLCHRGLNPAKRINITSLISADSYGPAGHFFRVKVALVTRLDPLGP